MSQILERELEHGARGLRGQAFPLGVVSKPPTELDAGREVRGEAGP